MHPFPDILAQAFGLEGRLAVVTGGGSGIGRAAALTFARAGAAVVISDINAEALAQTVALVEAEGGQAEAVVADSGDRADIEAVADRAASIKPIDVWCNVAGVGALAKVVEVETELYERVLRVNQAGVYWGCAAAGRRMIPQGRGSIINISSNAADEPIAGLSLYAMSKAAVNMLTRTLAAELGPHGVRVNAVAPGFTVTAMTTQGDEAARAEAIRRNAARSPLGRVGEPDDIALAMLYLAADASRFVTGQVLRVNGGVTMP